MFSTPAGLVKRTGKHDVDRPTYLKQLVEEYESESTSEEKKLQVLANLGNFAYDPINYEYFRRFNIIDIFLNNLKLIESSNYSVHEQRVTFSLAAVSNLCLDAKNKEYLIRNNIIDLVTQCLLGFKTVDEIVLNSITIFLFVWNENIKFQLIANKNLIEIINELNHSNDKRISNLIKLFLNDLYNK